MLKFLLDKEDSLGRRILMLLDFCNQPGLLFKERRAVACIKALWELTSALLVRILQGDVSKHWHEQPPAKSCPTGHISRVAAAHTDIRTARIRTGYQPGDQFQGDWHSYLLLGRFCKMARCTWLRHLMHLMARSTHGNTCI
jgi:hypothetical protein